VKLRVSPCILLLAAFFVAGRAWGEERTRQDVTFVLPLASVIFSEAYLAEDLGLWQKHGLNVKLIVVTSVGSINAIISGSAEFGITSAASLLRAAAKGQRLLAIAGVSNRSLIEIVLRKDIAAVAGFDPRAPFAMRARALRGRTLGIEGLNGQSDAYMRLAAKRAGFDPEQIRLAIMPVTSMSAALETRQIEGYVAAMPYPMMAVRDGTAVMLASGPDGEPADIVPLAFTLLVTRPETCEQRRMLCRAMGEAFADAAAFMKERPAEALALMQRRFSAMSGDTLALVFDAVLKATPTPPVVGRVELEHADRLNIESGLLNPADRLNSYDGLYTDEFVRDAD